MIYEMEALSPLTAKLAEKYTSKESSSVTWERAGKLMGAVRYCLREWEAKGGREGILHFG